MSPWPGCLLIGTVAIQLCAAHGRSAGIANPLLSAALLSQGDTNAEMAKLQRHHHDSKAPSVPDPAPRSFGGQCGIAACNDIPFPTPWSKDVDPEHPWPEYPRPQMQRQDWLNLNGVWEFEAAGADGHLEPALNRTLNDKILVPFPPEAPLSGLRRPDGSNVNLLYKRTFTVPSSWGNSRVLLHFGAVDYEAQISVNHLMLSVHRGGYNKFSLDITDALKLRTAEQCGPNSPYINNLEHHQHKGKHSGRCQGEVEHVLVVRAWDPADTQRITIGKQRLFPPRHPAGIFYTSTSGIWQTVWLEPVPEAHITQVVPTANLRAAEVSLHVRGNDAAQAQGVVAVVSSNGNALATACGSVGVPFTAGLDSPRLWSPEDPHLYDVDVALMAHDDEASCQEAGHALWQQVKPQGRAQQLAQQLRAFSAAAAGWLGLSSAASQGGQLSCGAGDRVRAYFGMREVGLGPVGPGGHPRPLINGEFVFQIGMLDQGYWPDGIYTAPTDEALIYDLQVAKRLGFNMLRKHTKIEPDRWYYHADRLGVLVWQDQPDQFGDDHPPPEVKAQFEHELVTMIEQHEEFPSIVAWVVFNEGWGQYDTERIVNMTKRLDPSRLADCASGWNDAPVGDFIDMHNYVGPGSPLPTPSRAAVLGEFGGLGLRVDGHRFIPQEDFCYELQDTSAQLEVRYLGLVEHLKELMMSNKTALSAAVYTELSDVEGEINGFMTYDRKVIKVEPYAMPAAHKGLLDLSRSLNKPKQ